MRRQFVVRPKCHSSLENRREGKEELGICEITVWADERRRKQHLPIFPWINRLWSIQNIKLLPDLALWTDVPMERRTAARAPESPWLPLSLQALETYPAYF